MTHNKDKGTSVGFSDLNPSLNEMNRGTTAVVSNAVIIAKEGEVYPLSCAPSGCNMCGGKLVEIRGKYPKTPKRMICPTCTYERLEQINDISSSNYGQAYQNIEP